MTDAMRDAPGWAARLLNKERELRMAWELERHSQRSTLVGTAHFFPYRFRAALRSRIHRADTVLLEGPLDEDSRRKVVAAGSARRGASLPDALDAGTLRRVAAVLDAASPPSAVSAFYWHVLRAGTPVPAGEDLRQLEPWMAFFHFWTEYRRRDSWLYSVDLDAAAAATALKKDVRFLETIDEQIATLGRVPLERIVRFLREVDWDRYRRDYVRHYLAGDLVGLAAMARAFPTYCEPVIEERDPVLAERMLPFLERGNAIAFVGVMHCRGLIALLRARGYSVAGPATF